MKRILRYRPSPATPIALTALIVAVGGVAYATIPDSEGAIHGCFQKNSGSLRVVESVGECRTSEREISWNQRGEPGPPGSGVVTRMRSGPVVFEGTGSSSAPEEKEVSLSGSTWTQGPDEFQEIVGQVDTDTPCSGASAVRPFVLVSLDGELVEHPGLDSGLTTFRIAVFETGQPQTHTVTITAADRCARVRGPSRINSIKLDVLGFE